MLATGNSNQPNPHIQQSIRVTADGLSFYSGPEAIVVDGPCTRLPLNQFDRADAATVLQYLVPAKPEEPPRTALYNVLPELEVVEIFGIETALYEELKSLYPRHRFLGINSMVLETMWRHDRSLGNANRRMYAWQHGKNMLVFYFSDEGLHSANTYTIENVDYAIYYALMMWRVYGLDPERDECLVIGDEAIAQGLQMFLRHTATLTPADILGEVRTASGVPFEIAVL